MRILLIGLFILGITGCANIKYNAPTGESFSYSRVGTQKISGFNLSKDKDGLIKVKFDSQEGAEGQAILSMAEAIKNMSKATP